MSIFYHLARQLIAHLSEKLNPMNRKQFLLTGFAFSPILALAEPLAGKKGKRSASKPFIVDEAKSRFGDVILFKGVNHNDLKISSKDTGGQLSVFEYRGIEKTGPSLHIHLYQDEIFTVTEGRFRFVVGEETHELNQGQTIFLPRGIAHTWIQLTEVGKLIYFLQPAGKMEEFFITLNGLQQMPTKAEMDRIHAEHGMKSVGPPLTL
jgi:quercetin 2,3-dioxygenase